MSSRERERAEVVRERERKLERAHTRIQAQPQGGKHTHLWIAENYATAAAVAAAGGGTRQQQQQQVEGG